MQTAIDSLTNTDYRVRQAARQYLVAMTGLYAQSPPRPLYTDDAKASAEMQQLWQA